MMTMSETAAEMDPREKVHVYPWLINCEKSSYLHLCHVSTVRINVIPQRCIQYDDTSYA
ncbi:hypothetical protein M378DRAFT_166032 [Amanita muscaria Koide BX008]|uniref:Uncharacterized protein n=1 Tax=Amanita muscaria (strain Koide BX008) TaxID=946122 RepID=A0A0C2SGE4_AMAMK|nr:hypothetical protein M378DRAFT_166032 [Amanita muscaria Koide BX008]